MIAETVIELTLPRVNHKDSKHYPESITETVNITQSVKAIQSGSLTQSVESITETVHISGTFILILLFH